MTEATGNVKLRPGYLVNLSTAVRGGISVRREVISEQEVDGTEIKEWNTEKRVPRAEEHRQATLVRLAVRDAVKRVCIDSPFGLICPREDVQRLNEVLEEHAERVREFNAESEIYKVRFSTMRGEIADNDREAVEAVRQEIGLLMADLEEATRAGDVKSARDVARRATQMNKLMEDESEASESVSRAVKAARRIARQVVKRVEKAGENLADVLQSEGMEDISIARFAFLGGDEAAPSHDNEEAEEVAAVEEPIEDEDDDFEPDISARFAGIV